MHAPVVRAGTIHPVTAIVTVDYDAESSWIQRARVGPFRGPTWESQGTFGPKVGIWRLLDLLDTAGIAGTFFVPGWVAETWADSVREIARRGHEIAVHGYLHENHLEFTSREEEAATVDRAGAAVAEVTGVRPAGFRPSAYLYSEHTLDLLRERGYVYGSGMHDDDAPYVHEGPGSGLVEIPVAWHLTDDLFGWHSDVRSTPDEVEQHWLTEYRGLRAYPGRAYVLTVHPEVVGRAGRIDVLRRVLASLASDGARFRTCGDVASDLVLSKARETSG